MLLNYLIFTGYPIAEHNTTMETAMFNRKHSAQARIIWRWVINLWRALILGKDHVLPFVSVFHLTHRCDANCTWCSQREVIGEEEHPELPLEKLRTVLLRLFRLSPAIYITGGEPTLVSLHSHDVHLQCNILRVHPRGVFRLITNLRAFRRIAEDHGNMLFINCVLSSENVHWATLSCNSAF